MDTATAVSGRQHMVSLEQANRVRLARAALRRKVLTDEIDVAAIVLALPWEAKSMPVNELLAWQKQWGLERSRKLLASIDLAEGKTLSSLTERQRTMLAAALLAAKARPSSNGAKSYG